MPGVPEALADPILKRFPLRRHRIPIGARSLSVVLPDDRTWLREGSWAPAVVRGKEPPYWIRVWPAAVALARQLARAGDLDGTTVLDLGCGVGLPGIEAAALGASVCFADREPNALAFARWNARHQPTCRHDVTVQQVDWSLGAVSGNHELVLLSDVSYHRSNHAPLHRQLERTLSDDACVLHADPMRELSSRFLVELAERYQLATRIVPTHHEGRRTPVRLAVAARDADRLEHWLDRLNWPSMDRGDAPIPSAS